MSRRRNNASIRRECGGHVATSSGRNLLLSHERAREFRVRSLGRSRRRRATASQSSLERQLSSRVTRGISINGNPSNERINERIHMKHLAESAFVVVARQSLCRLKPLDTRIGPEAWGRERVANELGFRMAGFIRLTSRLIAITAE